MSANRAHDWVLLLDSAGLRDIAEVSTGRPLPAVPWFSDPAAPDFLKSCLAITPESFAIAIMAKALRSAVADGTITQIESAKILFFYRVFLERDPFPPGFRLFA